MGEFEEFVQDLQQGLVHLYDPLFQPAARLWKVLGPEPAPDGRDLRPILVRLIESLQPEPSVPSNGRIRRLYDILQKRYIQRLTQEETAKQLGLSSRYLRREQEHAIRWLAQQLWPQSHTTEAGTGPPAADGEVASLPDWRLQVRSELDALEKRAPGMMVDMATVIDSVMALGRDLASRHEIRLQKGAVQDSLIIKSHPSALRQALMSAIGELIRHMAPGEITISAERREQQVKIAIAGAPIVVATPPDIDLISEILASQGGAIQTGVSSDRLSFFITLPAEVAISVFVVDDNADLVHVYRRYTMGTRYQIEHVLEGEQAYAAIKTTDPDVVVLDVMLPDTDGWELLRQLRNDPATHAIPIIICSVTRQEELALELGATLYLPKPVRRLHFIEALDRACSVRPQ